jgi:hypothetical protein
MTMQDVVSQYRELLVADESLPSLDNAIALAHRIASGQGGDGGDRWSKLIEGDGPSRNSGKRPESAMARRARDVVWALSTLSRKAEHHPKIPEAQYSLLMDALLILFHQAYFALLPKAFDRRADLLDAFTSFAAAFPSLPDRFQIEGLVQYEKGRTDAATECFRAALAATHSDEHDFLTRVQMVWSVLMEQRHYIEAFECLNDVQPRVARRDFEELSQLHRATLVEALSRSPVLSRQSLKAKHAQT